MSRKPHPGVLAALTAAVLFGASTPLSKLLLDHTSPCFWPRSSTWDQESGFFCFAWPAVRHR